MMFTIFDIAVFTVIAVSTIMGLYKGLLGMAINLAGFVASIAAAIFLFPYVQIALAKHIENELLLSILSGTISYICSLFILTSITSKIGDILSVISSGFVDRTLGAIAGLFRGLIISTVIFVLAAIFSSGAYVKAENVEEIVSNLNSEKYPDWLNDSKTTEYLEILLKELLALLPENTLQSIKLPKPEVKVEKGQEIIDNIKRRKGENTNP
ncbi:MAG: CvpA family protein [Alphaproteobacteria bacterium]|nr:CvpA family protein [Alphaproteobacteria bacterium]